MSAALTFKLTAEGRAALRNAQGNGTHAVLVATAGITADAFTPGEPLPNEIKRIATIAGGATAADTIHVTISDDTIGATYEVRGFGLYLNDANTTLLGSYGQTEVIVQKSAQATMLLAVDVKFDDIDATEITFGDTNFSNPQATTERMGVSELATDHETVAGRDATRTVTPKSLYAALDARLGENAPTDLAKIMLASPTSADVRELLGTKNAALFDTGAENGLDADQVDGEHGAFYLDWNNFTRVPATFNPSDHNHPITEVKGLKSALDAKLGLNGGTMRGPVSLAGGDAGVTPKNFDSSELLATTEFVQRALGSYSSYKTVKASLSITSEHAGGYLKFLTDDAGAIAALPSNVPEGAAFTITCAVASAPITVTCTGGFGSVLAINSVLTFSMAQGTEAVFVHVGQGSYDVISGAGAGALQTHGYQKFASGLILQWGQVSMSGTTTSITVALPIAWPNGILGAAGSDSGASGYSLGIQGVGKTHISIFAPAYTTHTGFVAAKNGPAVLNWFGIGH